MGPFYINFLYIVYIFPQMYENEHETIQNSCRVLENCSCQIWDPFLFCIGVGPSAPTVASPLFCFQSWCRHDMKELFFFFLFFFGWPCEYFSISLFCPVLVARLFFEINYKDIQMGYVKGNSTCNLLVQPCTRPDFVQLKLHPPSSLFLIFYLFYILFFLF